MTPEQIAELEAAEQAATPGPWLDILADELHVGVHPDARYRIAAFTDADARFIVLARNHIADLLAERRRLPLLEAVAAAAASLRDADIIVSRHDWPLAQELNRALAALRDEDHEPSGSTVRQGDAP